MYRKKEYCLHKTKVEDSVVLLPYKQHHVPKYHQWMSNPELRALTASDRLTLTEEYQMQSDWMSQNDKATFIILDKKVYKQNGLNEIDSMIGDVNLFLSDPNDVSLAEIEVMIADTHSRGKGYGHEACVMMMYYGSTELGIKTFQAKIGYDNIPSRNLFEKKLQFNQVSQSDVFKEVTLQFLPTAEFIKKIDNSVKWIKYNQLEMIV